MNSRTKRAIYIASAACIAFSALSLAAGSAGAAAKAPKPSPKAVEKWIYTHCGKIASAATFQDYLGVTVSSATENAYHECVIVNQVGVRLTIFPGNGKGIFDDYYKSRLQDSAAHPAGAPPASPMSPTVVDAVQQLGGVGKGAYEFTMTEAFTNVVTTSENELAAWDPNALIDIGVSGILSGSSTQSVAAGGLSASPPISFAQLSRWTRAIFKVIDAEANS